MRDATLAGRLRGSSRSEGAGVKRRGKFLAVDGRRNDRQIAAKADGKRCLLFEAEGPESASSLLHPPSDAMARKANAMGFPG